MELSLRESRIITDYNNKSRLDSVNIYLSKYNSESIRSLEKERVQISEKLELNKNKIKNIDKELNKNISNEMPIFLLEKYFLNISSMLEERKEKGNLPSDITEQFIDDLINRRLCICGNSVEEGSDEYEKLKKLKKQLENKNWIKHIII